MQKRSFRGLGEPVWVSALPSAGFRLGPDPRRALGPAANRAASTGRTRDRTRPILQQRHNVLARAPSTRDPTPKKGATPRRPAPKAKGVPGGRDATVGARPIVGILIVRLGADNAYGLSATGV